MIMTRTCEFFHHTISRDTRCRKHARVLANIQTHRRDRTPTNRLTVRRCWLHYMELENKARQSATMTITGAILYGPNEQKEPSHV